MTSNAHHSRTTFDHLYTTVYGVARDLTLDGAERARVIAMLSDLAMTWPECWNEAVERQIAELALASVHEPATVERLVGLLSARRSPLLSRVIVALSRRAYEQKHGETLGLLMCESTEFYADHAEIENAWIMQALRVTAGRQSWRASTIACGWLEARPSCSVWLRAFLELHPELTYSIDAEVDLFLLAPTAAGALEWAERAVEGWIVDIASGKVTLDLQLLAGVFAIATRQAKSAEVRAQIGRWSEIILPAAHTHLNPPSPVNNSPAFTGRAPVTPAGANSAT